MATCHGQRPLPRAAAKGHVRAWPWAMRKPIAEGPAPLNKGHTLGPWPGRLAQRHGRGLWPRAVAEGRGPGSWPTALGQRHQESVPTMGHGRAPWRNLFPVKMWRKWGGEMSTQTGDAKPLTKTECKKVNLGEAPFRCLPRARFNRVRSHFGFCNSFCNSFCKCFCNGFCIAPWNT